MDDFNGKRITVLGLGRFGGGIGVSKWLAGHGARVLVTDEAPADTLHESVRALDGLPMEFRLGSLVERDFTNADLLVVSPAIPLSHPMLLAAQRAGVAVTTEIRLFIERCPATIVGVTGTKGKSTTTALLGQMLEQKYRTFIGGNLGGSLLGLLPQMCAADAVVLELSSYMLEHLRPMRWSPDVAVVTMIADDHLQWHGGAAAYHDAKKNIVRFQTKDDFAILSEENAICASFATDTHATVSRYGIEGRAPFLLRIAGRHNQLNAQAAFAAANCLGVTREEAQLGIAGFEGLPHRMQVVHEEAGVTWINDSIATIPEAAIAASQSFPQGKVIQIVGGHDKQLDWSTMCRELARGCKAVLTIGEIGPQLAARLRLTDTEVRVIECGDLQRAVRAAKSMAAEGDFVLLSTGTASYDQFSNFEQRGEAFADMAKQP